MFFSDKKSFINTKYYFLKPGERVQKGDECFMGNKWVETLCVNKIVGGFKSSLIYRRIKNKKNNHPQTNIFK